MVDGELAHGLVKFFKSEKGWGAISSNVLPPGRDAFVHFTAIDGAGRRDFVAGQTVEFRYHAAKQDSFDFVVDWARAADQPEARPD